MISVKFFGVFLAFFAVFTKEYDLINVASWETADLDLKVEEKNFTIINYHSGGHEEKGDIVVYRFEGLSTVDICVYTNYNDIKQNEVGNFTDCVWKFDQNNNSLVILNNDTNYVLNGNYYFAIKVHTVGFKGPFVVFNELDSKNLDKNSVVILKQLYSKRQLSFNFQSGEKKFLIFGFSFKDDIDRYKNYEGSITIRDENKELKVWDKFTEQVFTFTKADAANKKYTITIKLNVKEYDALFNLQFEVNTLGGEPNEYALNETLKTSFYQGIKYHFFTDITKYAPQEEGAVEIFISNYTYFSEGLMVINNDVVDCDKTTINNCLPTQQKFGILSKLKAQGMYLIVPFIKTSNTQKNFIFSITFSSLQNYFELTFFFLPKFLQFNLSLKDFEKKKKVTTDKIYFNRKIPQYVQVSLEPGITEKKNVVVFVPEKRVTTFFSGPLLDNAYTPNEKYINSQIYVVQKNADFDVITISLSSDYTDLSIQFALDDSNIMYFNKARPINQPFTMDLLQCKDKLTLIEAYDDLYSENRKEVYLMYKPLYGEFDLNYLKLIDSPILYIPGRMIKLKDIVEVEANNVVYHLNCSIPSSILITFASKIAEDYYGKIENGVEAYFFIEREKSLNFDVYNDNLYYVYKINVELFGSKSSANVTYVNEKTEDFCLNETNRKLEIPSIFGKKDQKLPKLVIKASNEGALVGIKFVSSSIYSRIVEGNSDITFSSRRSLLKLKNEIDYDYLEINLYSKKTVKQVMLKYSFNYYQDNFYIPLPLKEKNFTSEMSLRFSNPYNKYNPSPKNGELFYFSIEFLNEDENDYNIFTDIKYYRGEAEFIDGEKGKVITVGNYYRMLSTKSKNDADRLVMDINQCENKNELGEYNIKIFYNDEESSFANLNFSKFSQLISVENLYNGTKFKIEKSNDSKASSKEVIFNYFFTNQDVIEHIELENNLALESSSTGDGVTLRWNSYVKAPSASANYDIYVLSLNNEKINNMCELMKTTPNYTSVNTSFELEDIPSGEYDVNIIARVNEEKYPVMMIYKSHQIKIVKKKKLLIITGSIIGGMILLVIIIFYSLRCRRKKKGDNFDMIPDNAALLKEEIGSSNSMKDLNELN